jgi:hypothetical protein
MRLATGRPSGARAVGRVLLAATCTMFTAGGDRRGRRPGLRIRPGSPGWGPHDHVQQPAQPAAQMGVVSMKVLKRTVGGGAILALLSTGLVFASGPASALPRNSNCQVIESDYNEAVAARDSWADTAYEASLHGDSRTAAYARDLSDHFERERVGYAQDFMANDC